MEKKIQCPCCGCYTIDGNDEVIVDICPVCYWQYDEVSQEHPDIVLGGPNGKLSLNQARKNYKNFGACCKDALSYVRQPFEEEKRNR